MSMDIGIFRTIPNLSKKFLGIYGFVRLEKKSLFSKKLLTVRALSNRSLALHYTIANCHEMFESTQVEILNIIKEEKVRAKKDSLTILVFINCHRG